MFAHALRRAIAMLALFLFPVLAEAAALQPKPKPPLYTVAVMPAVPAAFLKQYWQPILDQLARQTGLRFQLRLYNTMSDFERSISRDEVDIAVVSPLQVLAHRTQLHPLLRNQRAIIGLVVVPIASPLQTLSDLAGHAVATQASAGFPADVLVRRALLRAHTAPRFITVKTEINAAQSVTLKRADAAILSNYSLNLLPPDIAKQLRIIYQSPELAGATVATHARIPAANLQKIKAGFLQLCLTQNALLKPVLLENLVEADFNKDYAVLEQELAQEPTPVQGSQAPPKKRQSGSALTP